MAGIFYEHEAFLSPDTCGCTIARDSSLTGEAHRLSARYVTQCTAHAGSTAVEVHQHNVSKNVMVAALSEALPQEAWTPVFLDGAMPTKTSTGWQFAEADIVDRVIAEPMEYLLSPKTGQIAIRHPKADAAIMAKVAKALTDHPVANLSLANEPLAQAIFSAKDAALIDDGKPVFWNLDNQGKAEILQEANTELTVVGA